ncbi:MAG: pimeloyl-ACP methyl ester carboxylesterase [Planctomycetota bacterium]
MAALIVSQAAPSLSAQVVEKRRAVMVEKVVVAGRRGFLMMPPRAAPSESQQRSGIPWVWYAPTLHGLPSNAEKWMFDQFQAAGIAIAGVDVGESYGSPAGRRVFTEFHRHLVQKRFLAKQPCLLARSRGGLMLYGWAVEHPLSVAGIAGIYPVMDLTSYPGLAKACGAYGMSEAELTAALPRHNPMERLASLAKANVPIYHIHGDKDRVVPFAANSGALLQRYRKLGGQIVVRTAEGQGHNMWQGFFQDQALVDFVISSARTTKGVIDIHDKVVPRNAVQCIGPDGSLLVPEKPEVASQWQFDDGVLTASPSWDSVLTKESYQDFRMHIEFNVNESHDENPEANGNSGIYIQQRYELQILDSFGVTADSYKASYCGSLYRLKKPDQLVNKKAGEWQSYDIAFRAPVFQGKTKIHNARITAYQNGQLIHDDYELPRKTGAGQPEAPTPKPIKLQGHHNKVRFRNFWIQPL